MDKNIRIKNIGDTQSLVRLIKLDDESTVNIAALGNGESSAYKETVEDIKFSLFPLKQSDVVVDVPQEDILNELLGAGKISAAYIDAEELLVSRNEEGTVTEVHAKFTSRISDNILSNVIRKQHYFLNLGNASDVKVNNVSIRATAFDAGTGDMIGGLNQLLPTNQLMKTSTGDIIYPMTISEKDTQMYYDLIIDLDGERSQYAPKYHRVYVGVTVDEASESSVVTVRGFDSTLIAAVGSIFTYKKEANSFSVVDTTTSIKNLISKEVSALFQYKLDTSIVLSQTFVLQFEKHLVDEATTISMIVAGHEVTKTDLIVNAKLVGEKYLYPLTITNQARTPTVVDVTLDYDGSEFNDYIKTNYRFKFNSNITTPPPIPLFALSAMRARIEIKDENTYYYEGYRFLQFKLPITAAALVVIDIVANATNYIIKPIVLNNSILPMEDRAAAAAYAMYTEAKLYNNVEIGKERTFVYNQTGESVFQIKLPLGLTGTVYFGMTPINTNSNLLSYDDQQMQVIGMSERIPSLSLSTWNGITLNRYKDTDISKPYPGYYMFTDLIKPGTAIALGTMQYTPDWQLLLTRENIKLVELHQLDNTRSKEGDPDNIFISQGNLSAYKWSGATTSQIYFYGDYGFSLSDGMYVIYRTLDNKLLLLRYRTINGIVVEVASEKVLITDLALHGYTLDRPIKAVFTSPSSSPDLRADVTQPYEVTYEELTSFDPELTFTSVASIDVVDIYGKNTIKSN